MFDQGAQQVGESDRRVGGMTGGRLRSIEKQGEDAKQYVWGIAAFERNRDDRSELPMCFPTLPGLAIFDIGGAQAAPECVLAAFLTDQLGDALGFQLFAGQTDGTDDLQSLFIGQGDPDHACTCMSHADRCLQESVQQRFEIACAGWYKLLFDTRSNAAVFGGGGEVGGARPEKAGPVWFLGMFPFF